MIGKVSGTSGALFDARAARLLGLTAFSEIYFSRMPVVLPQVCHSFLACRLDAEIERQCHIAALGAL